MSSEGEFLRLTESTGSAVRQSIANVRAQFDFLASTVPSDGDEGVNRAREDS